MRLDARMHISARIDYALRALSTLAARGGEPLTAEELAQAQGLPVRFLRAILNDLRRVGIVTSQRGNEGGYQLARPASEITIGEVFRRLEGPLAEVRGIRPESANYEAAARASPRGVGRRSSVPARRARRGKPRASRDGQASRPGSPACGAPRRLGTPLTSGPTGRTFGALGYLGTCGLGS